MLVFVKKNFLWHTNLKVTVCHLWTNSIKIFFPFYDFTWHFMQTTQSWNIIASRHIISLQKQYQICSLLLKEAKVWQLVIVMGVSYLMNNPYVLKIILSNLHRKFYKKYPVLHKVNMQYLIQFGYKIICEHKYLDLSRIINEIQITNWHQYNGQLIPLEQELFSCH